MASTTATVNWARVSLWAIGGAASQALWDPAAVHIEPLLNRMLVSSDPKHEREGEQPNEAGRYGRGEYKEAGPQSWARPLFAELATIAGRDRKMPPRDLECMIGHAPEKGSCPFLVDLDQPILAIP